MKPTATKPHCCRKIAMRDPVGTPEKTLERNLLNVEHVPPLPLPNFTVGEVPGYPFDSNKTAFQGVGGVLIGSDQCNNEVNRS